MTTPRTRPISKKEFLEVYHQCDGNVEKIAERLNLSRKQITTKMSTIRRQGVSLPFVRKVEESVQHQP